MQARSIRRGPSSSSLSAEPQGAAQTTLTINLARLQQLQDRRPDRARGGLQLLPEFLDLGRLFVHHQNLFVAVGPWQMAWTVAGRQSPALLPRPSHVAFKA